MPTSLPCLLSPIFAAWSKGGCIQHNDCSIGPHQRSCLQSAPALLQACPSDHLTCSKATFTPSRGKLSKWLVLNCKGPLLQVPKVLVVVDGDPLQALSDIPTRHAASAQAAAERLDGEGSRHLQQKVSCVGIERQEPTMPQEGGVAKHARQPAVGRSCTACKIGSTLLTS